MKTLQQIPNLYPVPETMTGPGLADTRGERLRELNDNQAVPVYRVPWESYGHLANADADIMDVVWSVQDGRRDVRQLKKIKEL